MTFWRPFDFKSFQNAKICLYTPQNDNEIKILAILVKNEKDMGVIQELQVNLNFLLTNVNAPLKINEFKLKLTYRSVFPLCYCSRLSTVPFIDSETNL